jgi:predicted transcriptional regulator of viral defense system
MTYKTSKASGEILEKIKTEIDRRGGIVKTEQLDEMGIDYRRVLDFVESGELIRVKNGYYTDRIDRFTETELVAKLFPDGLLCMESALYVYGYLSEKPYGWRIAVDKNTSKSRFVMDYPKVIPYYTEPEALQIGASEIELDGVRFGIYDKERTICDCLKYESKMERSSFQAAIQAYIREEDKDISLLLEYARARKVIKKVQSMIGVWL